MSATESLLLYHEDGMAFPTPQYSRSAVDKAGALLCLPHQVEIAGVWTIRPGLSEAYEKVNNWRSCHSYPLNTFNATVRNKVKSVCDKPIVAQRLKRYESIVAKLRRQRTQRLSQMQDIGGLRVVVDNTTQVNSLRKSTGA
jgi:putative GTP pyrophosphokinase